MKVPLVDLSAQHKSISRDIDSAIHRVIAKSSFVLGEEVDRFEENWALFIEVNFCIGVNSGTSALYLALLAADIPPGSEVIIPANTFIATAAAVTMAGAKVVLVDCDENYLIDTSKIEEKITKNTSAIIPVHLYGQCADMMPIMELSRKYNLTVIEDACQAHGASYGGRKAGSIGHLGCFSFYPGKNLGSCGEGGAVVTNISFYAEKLRKLRNHGGTEKYQHDILGGNYRLEAMQAAILSAKLPHLEFWNAKRQATAKKYDDQLGDLIIRAPMALPVFLDYGEHVWHLYVIRAVEREKLMESLKNENIQTGIHYPQPIHFTRPYSYLGVNTKFSNAEVFADSILSLPMFPEITDDQIDFVVSEIGKFYKR